MDAIIYSKDCYYPYDEPSIDCNLYMYLLDDTKHPELQKSIQKNNYFGMDSSVADYYTESGLIFKDRSKRTIEYYKELGKRTAIDFDVTYEKK